MSDTMWIRSHVELLLQREWGAEDVVTDEDRDFPFRAGTAICWVSVIESERPMVRFSAMWARGLKPSYKLLRELNEIQRGCMCARIELASDVVIASQTISPIGLTQPVLAQAIDAVGTLAKDFGGVLASMFGGYTPFDAELTDCEDA